MHVTGLASERTEKERKRNSLDFLVRRVRSLSAARKRWRPLSETTSGLAYIPSLWNLSSHSRRLHGRVGYSIACLPPEGWSHDTRHNSNKHVVVGSLGGCAWHDMNSFTPSFLGKQTSCPCVSPSISKLENAFGNTLTAISKPPSPCYGGKGAAILLADMALAVRLCEVAEASHQLHGNAQPENKTWLYYTTA